MSSNTSDEQNAEFPNAQVPSDPVKKKTAKKAAKKAATKKTAKKAAKKATKKVAKKTASKTATNKTAPEPAAKQLEPKVDSPTPTPATKKVMVAPPAPAPTQAEAPKETQPTSQRQQSQPVSQERSQQDSAEPRQERQQERPRNDRQDRQRNDSRRNSDKQGNNQNKNRNDGNERNDRQQNRNDGNDRNDRQQNRNDGNERNADSPRGNQNKNRKQNTRDRTSNRDRQQQRPQGKKKTSKNRNRDNRQQDGNRQHREKKDKKPIELTGDPVAISGMLEVAPKGFGFLRVQEKDWEQSRTDVFVTPDTIRKYGLRHGAWIIGFCQEGPRGPQLVEITTINDKSPDDAKKFPHFDELKAVNPNKRISVETTSDKFTTRIVDIIAPIGRGQRGLIVSPPRSGKTTIMVDIAEAIIENHEDTMKLIILLVDERPEEVTDFKRRLPGVEIYSSSNDSGARNHCRMAELCIERAKRLVESGEHVFILMDSITRLARAYNHSMNGDKQSKGKGYQSGGIVAGALEMPRRIFAAARNTRTAGSLTIVATALVQTNSRADDAIFQEFKGTGNMELVLDRRMAEQYLYPAVDIFKSGTRREELLLPDISLRKINMIRRGLAGHKPEEAIERLLFFLKRFHNNAQMLMEIKG